MRTITAQALASLLSQDGGYSLPVFLKITHGVAGYTDPWLIVNNSVDLDYDGDTYTAAGFRFDPPDQKDQGVTSNARITFCAVDQTIAAILRSTVNPPTVEVVAAYYSDETGTEVIDRLVGWTFTLRNVTGSSGVISADLIYDDVMDFEFPVDEFRPNTFPGLF